MILNLLLPAERALVRAPAGPLPCPARERKCMQLGRMRLCKGEPGMCYFASIP